MTQKNIEIMDTIVNELVAGKKISEALSTVYVKRNVAIPFNNETFRCTITSLGFSNRTSNALLRAKLSTINDVIEYIQKHKITEVKNFGINSAIELQEAMLDYAWNHMPEDKKVEFLIDTVERNSGHIREELR